MSKKKKRIPDGPEQPFCPDFEMCGGCTYQRFSYEGQRDLKLERVQGMLREVCPDFPLYECLDSPARYEYRNKMEFSFGDQMKDGPLTLGLHQRGSFYNIVPILDCKIVDSDYRAILWTTMQYFREKGVSYVHKRTHEGFLRHLLVRKSTATGELMVALVTSSDETVKTRLCHDEEYIHDTDNSDPDTFDAEPSYEYGECSSRELMEEYVERLERLELRGSLSGVLHIINDSLADVVQADEIRLLYGKDWIEERLLGLKFKITPFSFFQTNSPGAEVLYSVVRDYIGDVSGMTVFDLYSGTGTIAQLLAPVAKRVIGVEIVEEAVEAARENAALNGLKNCEFIAGDVLQVLDDLSELPDVMVLDPPRDGIHPKALPKLMDYGVEHFVYVACKPESLARDLPVIMEAGYKPVKAVCVDMFPWTKHVETVVQLVNIGVKPD